MAQNTSLGQGNDAPPEVASVAHANGLGALQRVCLPKRLNWFLVILGILFGLATTIALVGFWILWLMFRTPNLSRSQANRRVYLYENGFICVDKPGDVQVYRWDNVDTVFQKIVSQRTYGVETRKTYLYTVTRRDGRVVKLTEFWADIPKLGPHINECVSEALLPGSLAALDRGQGLAHFERCARQVTRLPRVASNLGAVNIGRNFSDQAA
jgi:hypothetical protein